eukprot:scaffold305711_cov27-Tisochrysis_lutea.AAC.2
MRGPAPQPNASPEPSVPVRPRAAQPGKSESASLLNMSKVVPSAGSSDSSPTLRTTEQALSSSDASSNIHGSGLLESAGESAYARPQIDEERRARSPGLSNNFYDANTSDFKKPYGKPTSDGSFDLGDHPAGIADEISAESSVWGLAASTPSSSMQSTLEIAGEASYDAPPINEDRRSRSPGLINNFFDVPTKDFKKPYGIERAAPPSSAGVQAVESSNSEGTASSSVEGEMGSANDSRSMTFPGASTAASAAALAGAQRRKQSQEGSNVAKPRFQDLKRESILKPANEPVSVSPVSDQSLTLSSNATIDSGASVDAMSSASQAQSTCAASGSPATAISSSTASPDSRSGPSVSTEGDPAAETRAVRHIFQNPNDTIKAPNNSKSLVNGYTSFSPRADGERRRRPGLWESFSSKSPEGFSRPYGVVRSSRPSSMDSASNNTIRSKSSMNTTSTAPRSRTESVPDATSTTSPSSVSKSDEGESAIESSRGRATTPTPDAESPLGDDANFNTVEPLGPERTRDSARISSNPPLLQVQEDTNGTLDESLATIPPSVALTVEEVGLLHVIAHLQQSSDYLQLSNYKLVSELMEARREADAARAREESLLLRLADLKARGVDVGASLIEGEVEEKTPGTNGASHQASDISQHAASAAGTKKAQSLEPTTRAKGHVPLLGTDRERDDLGGPIVSPMNIGGNPMDYHAAGQLVHPHSTAPEVWQKLQDAQPVHVLGHVPIHEVETLSSQHTIALGAALVTLAAWVHSKAARMFEV